MHMQKEKYIQELLPIVAKLSEKYTGGTSTSVTFERAQELMEAVLYCIHEYEQEQDFQNALMASEAPCTEEYYQKGFELVVRKVKKMRAFYNRLSERFDSYGCKNLEAVMEKGLPEFFRRYDARFAPHHTLLTLDYPTLLPMNGSAGIDAVEQYLSYLSLEQKFLRVFERTYVLETFGRYDWNYKEQFFNLCQIFLEHVLGCILMGKPLQAAAAPEHQDRLERWLETHSKEDMQKDLAQVLKRLVDERFRGNELLYEYLAGALPDLTVRLLESRTAVFSWML